MRALEKKAERNFVKRMRLDYNIRAVKYKDESKRGAPDRLVLLPKVPIFIEFKRDVSEDLRKEQEHYHDILKKLGYQVFTCYTAEEAIAICEKEMEKRNDKSDLSRARQKIRNQ
jgi:hypothetical protein